MSIKLKMNQELHPKYHTNQNNSPNYRVQNVGKLTKNLTNLRKEKGIVIFEKGKKRSKKMIPFARVGSPPIHSYQLYSSANSNISLSPQSKFRTKQNIMINEPNPPQNNQVVQISEIAQNTESTEIVPLKFENDAFTTKLNVEDSPNMPRNEKNNVKKAQTQALTKTSSKEFLKSSHTYHLSKDSNSEDCGKIVTDFLLNKDQIEDVTANINLNSKNSRNEQPLYFYKTKVRDKILNKTQALFKERDITRNSKKIVRKNIENDKKHYSTLGMSFKRTKMKDNTTNNTSSESKTKVSYLNLSIPMKVKKKRRNSNERYSKTKPNSTYYSIPKSPNLMQKETVDVSDLTPQDTSILEKSVEIDKKSRNQAIGDSTTSPKYGWVKPINFSMNSNLNHFQMYANNHPSTFQDFTPNSITSDHKIDKKEEQLKIKKDILSERNYQTSSPIVNSFIESRAATPLNSSFSKTQKRPQVTSKEHVSKSAKDKKVLFASNSHNMNMNVKKSHSSGINNQFLQSTESYSSKSRSKDEFRRCSLNRLKIALFNNLKAAQNEKSSSVYCTQRRDKSTNNKNCCKSNNECNCTARPIHSIKLLDSLKAQHGEAKLHNNKQKMINSGNLKKDKFKFAEDAEMNEEFEWQNQIREVEKVNQLNEKTKSRLKGKGNKLKIDSDNQDVNEIQKESVKCRPFENPIKKFENRKILLKIKKTASNKNWIQKMKNGIQYRERERRSLQRQNELTSSKRINLNTGGCNNHEIKDSGPQLQLHISNLDKQKNEHKSETNLTHYLSNSQNYRSTGLNSICNEKWNIGTSNTNLFPPSNFYPHSFYFKTTDSKNTNPNSAKNISTSTSKIKKDLNSYSKNLEHFSLAKFLHKNNHPNQPNQRNPTKHNCSHAVFSTLNQSLTNNPCYSSHTKKSSFDFSEHNRETCKCGEIFVDDSGNFINTQESVNILHTYDASLSHHSCNSRVQNSALHQIYDFNKESCAKDESQIQNSCEQCGERINTELSSQVKRLVSTPNCATFGNQRGVYTKMKLSKNRFTGFDYNYTNKSYVQQMHERKMYELDDNSGLTNKQIAQLGAKIFSNAKLADTLTNNS